MQTDINVLHSIRSFQLGTNIARRLTRTIPYCHKTRVITSYPPNTAFLVPVDILSLHQSICHTRIYATGLYKITASHYIYISLVPLAYIPQCSDRDINGISRPGFDPGKGYLFATASLPGPRPKNPAFHLTSGLLPTGKAAGT
jgi:hypothetical protein